MKTSTVVTLAALSAAVVVAAVFRVRSIQEAVRRAEETFYEREERYTDF